jgi:hypothetical protein
VKFYNFSKWLRGRMGWGGGIHKSEVVPFIGWWGVAARLGKGITCGIMMMDPAWAAGEER